MRTVLVSAAAAAVLVFSPAAARAAPLGGVVTAGAASITRDGVTTTINQSSDRAVIDWQAFNLAAGETARFVVPTSTSATINRISGGMSTISGTVESNGAVYFTNANGLVFDASSRVTTNGFTASASSLQAIILDGTIKAPSITAMAGTITVNGTMQSASGTILISSTAHTIIGAGAVISVDAESRANGGRIKIWSDNHTDFYGLVTARGGAQSGDGGSVEVSGKLTLNYNGLVNTLAPHGKTGSLLLDPTDITISDSPESNPLSPALGGGTMVYRGTSPTSSLSTASLQNQLAFSNVVIDANAGSGTGSGTITVASDIDPAISGGNSLTLQGAKIILKANITMATGGNVILIANRGAVWQDSTKVINANSLSGSAVDGFVLNGLNQLVSLRSISNRGAVGISIRNGRALTLAPGISLEGGAGGVAILNPGFDVTLAGDMTVGGSFLRLDVGGRNHLLGRHSITAREMNLYYTSDLAGNLATIEIGGGTFTYVTDNRSITIGKSLTNSTAADWGRGLGFSGSGPSFASGGLTVTTSGSNSLARVSTMGVVYGGEVLINGVTSAATSGINDLTYIEGLRLSVLGAASHFSGPLSLVASGGGSLAASGGSFNGINITAAIKTGVVNDGSSFLNLIQRGDGTINDFGIGVFSGEITTGGHLNVLQLANVSGEAIDFSLGSVSAGGSITISQSGQNDDVGINIDSVSLTAAGSIALHQLGDSGHEGINLSSSVMTAGGDITVLQSGTVGTGRAGILLNTNMRGHINQGFTVGRNGLFTLKTNNAALNLGSANSVLVTNGRVRIDLGTGSFTSSGNHVFNAQGLDIYYSGAAVGNSAKMDIGRGSFTAVAKASGDQSLDAAIAPTVANYSWVVNGSVAVSSIGVGFATDGILSINDSAKSTNYSYLEGASIAGAVVGVLGSRQTSPYGTEFYARTAVAVDESVPPTDITTDPPPTEPPTETVPVLPIEPLPPLVLNLDQPIILVSVDEVFNSLPIPTQFNFSDDDRKGNGKNSLFTESDSKNAPKKSEQANRNINDPKLRAIMNSLLNSPDYDSDGEESADSYMQPLNPNIEKWGN